MDRRMSRNSNSQFSQNSQSASHDRADVAASGLIQQHYSQALTPSKVMQADEIQDTYFSMPNSSKHRDLTKVPTPAGMEIRDSLSNLKDESSIITS